MPLCRFRTLPPGSSPIPCQSLSSPRRLVIDVGTGSLYLSGSLFGPRVDIAIPTECWQNVKYVGYFYCLSSTRPVSSWLERPWQRGEYRLCFIGGGSGWGVRVGGGDPGSGAGSQLTRGQWCWGGQRPWHQSGPSEGQLSQCGRLGLPPTKHSAPPYR